MLNKIINPFLSFLFSLIACGLVQAQTVAIVGNKKITLDEFKKHYKLTEGIHNRPSPEVFLEELVRFEMGVQEAQKQKLDQHPIVKERLKQEIYKLLLEQNLSEGIQKIQINEKEMRLQYRKTPELRISDIVIIVKPTATATQRKEAEDRARKIYKDVVKQLKSGRKFPELVKLYSDDALSKAAGGDVGYVSSVTLNPNIYNVANSMKVGQVKGVLETRDGFHIVKLTDKRSYEQADKTQLRHVVYETKRKVLFDNYFRDLKSKYKTQYFKNVLKSL